MKRSSRTSILVLGLSLLLLGKAMGFQIHKSKHTAKPSGPLWFKPSSLPSQEAHRQSHIPRPFFQSNLPVSSKLSLSLTKKDDEYGRSYELDPQPTVSVDALVAQTSQSLKSLSWVSWWSQVILTTISAVILAFARNVVVGSAQGAAAAAARKAGPNFFLSATGLIVSAISIIWTWGNGARLSRRMIRKPTSRIQAATLLRRAIRVGGTLNMFGLLLNLIAAEEIVGALAIKVLTNRPSQQQLLLASAGAFAGLEGLQPLDILVVQANTNSLLSHFCSLASLLYLTRNVDQLDPPSTEENPR